jgi:hypothetical protein
VSIARWNPGVFGYPAWAPYSFGNTRQVQTVPFTGDRYEQRVRRDRGPYRDYGNITIRAVSDAQRDAIEDFFSGLGYEADSFLVEDPRKNYVAGLAVAVAIAAQTVFPLPTSGNHRGAYPFLDPRTVLYDNGAVIARTVQTDARTLTASGGAPGAGHVITADVYFWLRVVLRGRYQWQPGGEGAVWEASMHWEEVPA